MLSSLISDVEVKMQSLNSRGEAVIFIVTGPNGSGKTVITKRLLTNLPFHQTYNLGAVAKTIRYIFHDADVTRLENFTNESITSLFTPVVQFACGEYRKNGVNVIIDGVQIDTSSTEWKKLISGGVVLFVDHNIKLARNQNPETHFNRSIKLTETDTVRYKSSRYFEVIDNNQGIEITFTKILHCLSKALDKQLARTELSSTQQRNLSPK